MLAGLKKPKEKKLLRNKFRSWRPRVFFQTGNVALLAGIDIV